MLVALIADLVVNIALITGRLLIIAQMAAETANSLPHHLYPLQLLAHKQFFTANFTGAGESTTKQANAATVKDATTSQVKRRLRSCCSNYCWKAPDALKLLRMGTRLDRFRARCRLQRPQMRCGACLHYSDGCYSLE